MKYKNSAFIKRAMAVLFAFLLTLNSVTCVWANPVNTHSNVAELRKAVENRLSSFNEANLSKYGGVLGVFYNMELILSQAIWTDFVINDTTLGISKATKDYQKETLVKAIREFNKTFGKDTEKYKGIILDQSSVGSPDGESLNNFSLNNLATDMSRYATDYINKISEGKEDKEVVEQHKKELRYIYQMVETCVDDVKDINSLIPAKEIKNSDGSIKLEPQTPYAPGGLSPLTDMLDAQKNAKIAGILRKAQELANSELQEITPDKIDNNKELLDRFYKDGTFTTEKLINSYYMILSASAVYEPFVSHVGDDTFLTALKELSGEHGSTSPLLKMYNDAKMYKKPLYHRDLDREGKPKGAAERVTMSAFIDYMRKDTSGALVMPKGVYEQGKDSNSYMIYNAQRFYYTKEESKKGASTTNDKSSGMEDTKEEKKDDSGDMFSDDDTSATDSDEEKTDAEKTNSVQTPQQDKEARSDRYEWKKSLEDTEAYSHDMPITNEDNMTPPVFIWGNKGLGDQLYMGTVLGRNIVSNVAKLDKFSKDNGLLFMNAFGDIVSEDDTVIVPGAANPGFYNEDQYYYPYTMAFMKSYPSLKVGTKVFESTNKLDEGKFVLALNSNKDGDSDKSDEEKDAEKQTETISGTKLNETNSYDIIARRINDDKSLTMDAQQTTDLKVQATMKQMGEGIPTMLMFKHLNFEKGGFTGFFSDLANNVSSNNWMASSKEMIMLKSLQSTYSNQSKTVLFDTNLEDMQPKDLAMIATNFYWGIMADEQGNLVDPNDKLNQTLLAKWVVPEALNGLQDAIGYTKNTFDYQDMVDDQYGRFIKLSKDIVEGIIKAPAHVRGILGIQSAYQNPIFGQILVNYKVALPILVVLVIVLCVIRFMSARSDLGQLAVVIVSTLACTIFFTSIFPVYIPMIYNVGTNNMTKNLAYTSLLMKSEDYDNLMKDKENEDGELELQTMSVNLYKLNKTDLEYVCNKLNITPTEAGSGKAFPIDSTSGIYLEGNIVKLNLDKLFSNLPITGKYKPGDNGKAYYQLEMEKRVTSGIDYYIPYHLIVQQFINKLNTLAKVYELNRSTVKYDKMVKDSFMVNAYINSAPFLIPGDYEKMSETIEPDVVENIKTAFGDNEDWLGISEFLTKPPEKGQDSLWYQTLKQNGYIHEAMYNLQSDSNPKAKAARDKMNKLIHKVNMLTKEFVLKNKDCFTGMSDENIIKIISLHATLIFCQQGGDWWANMYPMFLNSEELSLNDVLVAAYTSNADRFRSEEMDIVSYITYKYSGFGLFVLTFNVLMISFAVTIIQLFIPLLYVLLFVFAVFKFAGNRALDKLTSGFMKCAVTIFILFTLNSLGMYIAFNIANGGIALMIQFIISLTICDTLLRLICAIFKDPTNLGDSQFHTVAPWVMQATGMLDALDELKVKTSSFRKGYDPRFVDGMVDKSLERFKHNRGIDEFYNSEVMMKGSIDRHRKREESVKSTVGTLYDEYEDFKHL
ncbi:hypothetical protein UT300012_24060 [Paraclostridium bifermentans]